MLPTKQSLEADNLKGIHLKHWLVEHTELAPIEGRAQIGLELEASDGTGVHGGIEKFGTISTHALGATESGFGVGK